jgi:PAS domain S-box-containing protein
MNPDVPNLTRLRQAVDASGEVIFMTDREGIFTFVNPQFERLYGYSASEVVGKVTPRILKSDRIPPERYADLWRRLAEGESVEAAFVNRTKDGRVVDVAATANPIWDEARAIVGFLAIQRDVTERKAAEEALRHEQNRTARYLEVADVILLALDLQGRITMINRKGCSILGWDEHQLIGQRFVDVCLPARLRGDLTRELGNLHRGGASLRENPVLTKSGSERLIAWRNTVLRDDGGHVVGTLSSGEDITERRQAERALAESQAQLQLISDNVLDLVGRIGLDGTFVYVSPSYEVVLGYPPQSLIGTSAFALVHPGDLDRVLAVFAETLEHGRSTRIECRIICADSRWLWIETVGNVLFDGTGTPIGGVLSSRDISARKRSEEVLRDSDRRLQVATASAGMTVFAQDRDLRFTWLHNPQILGRQQVLGKTDLDLFPREFAEQLIELKRRALESGERVREEVTGKFDGKEHTFDLILEPLKDADGNVEGLTGAALDTTARRHLELQLRQAQKLEAIGSLAGGIAHDFNNLLTAITGYAELAISDLDPDSEIRPYVEQIVDAARSAESLTQQLLIFSRKSIVQPVVLRLNDVVGRLDKILRRMVGEHVEFDVRLGEDLGSVRADAGQLEQVLMNLVVNARDAMPTGGVLTIETRAVALDESFVCAHGGSAAGAFDSLTVADTGCGMSPDVQAQIFEPFFTTKGPQRGTGLGLATVHGIVQRAQGYITVTSAPGRGTSFTVYLPRVAEPSDALASGADGTAVPGGTETILFVEDNDAIRAMAVRALERCGYAVTAASDGIEALMRAERHPGTLDLLITDVVMPQMNGRVLAERLQESRPGLKVVFTSGFTDDSELLRGIRSGGTPFVQKPYTMDSLARTIRRELDRA